MQGNKQSKVRKRLRASQNQMNSRISSVDYCDFLYCD